MILVTGGAGYIGSHCIISLLENNYDVVIFDNLSTGHIETVNTLKQYFPNNLYFVQGDLLEEDKISNLFKSYKINAVMHFAAFSQVEESIINPQKYYYNNILGVLNLIRAMLDNNVFKIVFSSSAAIYGIPEYSPINENHPQKPINPYGNTKYIIEKILDDYDRAYNLKSVRLRYFNAAGADSQLRLGEWHIPETHLIPNILSSDSNKIFNLYGNNYDTFDGTCIRDFINVEDLASAHIKSLEYLDNNESNFFNIGTSKGYSVKEVFNLCEEIKGSKILINYCPKREGDPSSLIADISKAQNILNWTPKKSLYDSIKTAYLWQKKLNTIIKT